MSSLLRKTEAQRRHMPDSCWSDDQMHHCTQFPWDGRHLARYVVEFAGRHNIRPLDTKDQMRQIANDLSGHRLRYKDLGA